MAIHTTSKLHFVRRRLCMGSGSFSVFTRPFLHLMSPYFSRIDCPVKPVGWKERNSKRHNLIYLTLTRGRKMLWGNRCSWDPSSPPRTKFPSYVTGESRAMMPKRPMEIVLLACSNSTARLYRHMFHIAVAWICTETASLVNTPFHWQL